MWAKIGYLFIRICAILVFVLLLLKWTRVEEDIEECPQLDVVYLKGKVDALKRSK